MNIVRNYPAHHLDGSYKVKIVAVETPCRIFVTLENDTERNEEFLGVVRSYNYSTLNKLLEEEIFCGSPVFVNIASQFHRGAIVEQTRSTDNIRVWLGDYAREVVVALDDLYVMPEIIRRENWRALACGLAGIRPVQDDKWTDDTCDALRECLIGREMIMETIHPDLMFEAVWVDIGYNDEKGKFHSIIDEMVEVGHAKLKNAPSDFDWGDGVNLISDRRATGEMLRKWNMQRITPCLNFAGRNSDAPVRTGSMMQPDSGWMDAEMQDSGSSTDQIFWHDDQADATHAASRNSPAGCWSLNSCGESEDEDNDDNDSEF